MREGRVQWAGLLMASLAALFAAVSVQRTYQHGTPWWVVAAIVTSMAFVAVAAIGLLFGGAVQRAHGRVTRRQGAKASHRKLDDGSIVLELELRDEHVSQVSLRIRVPGVRWVDGLGAVRVPHGFHLNLTNVLATQDIEPVPGRYHVRWIGVGGPSGNVEREIARDRFRIKPQA